ncbi:MAG: lysophospholipid acyltransferase family protein [Cyclobacteriaceae bacterium]
MLVVLLKILSWLPLSVLYRVSDICARLASMFYRRNLVKRNLTAVFKNRSPEQLGKIADKFYHHLADVFVESIKLHQFSIEELTARISLEKSVDYQKLKQEQSPVLLFSAHFGNWEWYIPAVHHYLVPMNAVYKPLSNSRMNKWMINVRMRHGANVVPMKNTLRAAKKMTGRTGLALGADQAPRKNIKSKIWVEFMGKETAFYSGLINMPFLTQYPAYFTYLHKLARGNYELRTIELGRPPYGKDENGVLQKYLEICEEVIKSNPEQWLWTHNRWKYDRRNNEELIKFSS